MKHCEGFWPDLGTPCLRITDESGKCPKLHDTDHVDGGYWPAHTQHRVIPVESCVTGEIIARFCPDCDERVDR